MRDRTIPRLRLCWTGHYDHRYNVKFVNKEDFLVDSCDLDRGVQFERTNANRVSLQKTMGPILRRHYSWFRVFSRPQN